VEKSYFSKATILMKTPQLVLIKALMFMGKRRKNMKCGLGVGGCSIVGGLVQRIDGMNGFFFNGLF